MTLKIQNLFKKVFATSILFVLIGAFMKINHWDYSLFFLIIGLIATFSYIFIGIYEVNNSKKINYSEKVLWIIGFILFSFFTGLFYVANGRKNIV